MKTVASKFLVLLLVLISLEASDLKALQKVNPHLDEVSFTRDEGTRLLQLESALASAKTDVAIEMLVQVVEESDTFAGPNQPLIEVSGSPPAEKSVLDSYRTYSPEGKEIGRWVNSFLSRASVEFREQWRRRTKLAAETRYALAMEQGTDAALNGFLHRYFHARQGKQVLLELAGRCVRRGEISDAIRYLKRVDPRFHRFGGSDSGGSSPASLPAAASNAETGAKLVLLKTISNKKLSPESIQWFEETFPGSVGTLGQRNGPLLELLKGELQRLSFSNAEEATQQKQATKLTSRWVQEVSTTGVGSSLPALVGEAIVWADWKTVRAAGIRNGASVFGTRATRANARSFDVWRGRFPDAEVSNGHVSNISSSTVGSKQMVFATVNEEEGYLLGLDFSKQGKLLPGFPLPAFGSSWRFNGAPLVQDGRLYVASLRPTLAQQSKARQATVLVSCFELAAVDDGSPLNLLWTKQLFQTQMQNNVSFNQPIVGLKIDGEHLLVNSHCGAVVSLNIPSVRIEWMLTYPSTDWQAEYSDAGKIRAARLGQPPVVFDDTVFVLPADSYSLIAIDRQSGLARWQMPLPAAQKILDVSQQSILVSGLQLYWLAQNEKKETPTIADRFPDGFVNTSGDIRRPANLLAGSVVVDGSTVWVADGPAIYRLPRESQQAGFARQQVQLAWKSSLQKELNQIRQQEVRRQGHLIQKDDMMIYFDGVYLHGIQKNIK